MAARVVAVALGVLALCVPMRSAADVAGTGTFDVFLDASVPPPTFDGEIFFDGGMKRVLGQNVNLAANVGTMTYDGEMFESSAAQSVLFTLEADADETDVSIVAGGSASCAAGCVTGRVTFAGLLEVELDDENALPDAAVYTFDGTVQLDDGGEGIGTFAINAFPIIATPPGAGVKVTSGVQTFFDSITGTPRSFEAHATFANVTAAGTTSFAALSAVSGALPAGVTLDAAVSSFVDVRSTEAFGGDARLCLAVADADADGVVDETTIAVSQLRLLRAEAVGTAFVDVTAEPEAGAVCGSAPAAGPIVIGVAEADGGTTTTTVADGATTTTTSTTVPTGESTTTSTLAGDTSTTSTTSTTVPDASTSTTSSTLIEGETTTTLAAPGSTSTTAAPGVPTTTSTSFVRTTTTAPARSPSTSTSLARATTTSTTLPVCATALDCLELAIAGPLCPGESINRKLITLVFQKLTKAQRALMRAQTAGGGKSERLIAKARKQMDKLALKVDAFASRPRRPISVGCRNEIQAAIARVVQQIDARKL
jgi:hypothetical protein